MIQKLRAFTLMELLIGMIISSIVIGFGYGTYSLIYKQYLSYKAVKMEVVEVTQLNSILHKDFYAAEMISFRENKLTINRKDNFHLYYDFSDSLILRTDKETVDTFKITPVACAVSYIFPDQEAIVTDFSFEAKVLNETENFVFNKNYSSETLMNYANKFKN